MIESWLFVMMIDAQSLLIPNPLKLFRRNENLLVEDTELDADSEVFDEDRHLEVNKYIIALIICSGVAGLGSEFLQRILSGGRRNFDIFDVLFDTFGSLTGIAIAYFQEQYMYKSNQPEQILMTF
ncbi:Uncharacterized protein RNJ44_01580 [Nakaseomyces bracarensis]|uniref:VanZ-like domain-containing protein n=1 Tax=Nakaseomyces bracarensis TaxID=273131 RepID=A0ABR4NQC0_9SACH